MHSVYVSKYSLTKEGSNKLDATIYAITMKDGVSRGEEGGGGEGEGGEEGTYLRVRIPSTHREQLIHNRDAVRI
jgi:hypothetical protein